MSSPGFSPDAAIAVDPLWSTVWLSTRDLSRHVPINYLTRPSISLRTACFGNNTYLDEDAEKCLSNLLAARFEHLVLDLYWDAESTQFSFCPVAIPNSAASTSPITPITASLTSGLFDSSNPTPTATSTSSNTSLQARETKVSSSNTANSTFAQIVSLVQTIPTQTSTSGSTPQATPYQAGPYKCSETLNLSWLIQLIDRFISGTETTLKANVVLLEFNLHAAVSANNPTGPALQPSALPSSSSLIGSQFSSLGPFIYTPIDLESERANLNLSWYDVPSTIAPIDEYVNLTTVINGDLTTTTGWPNTAYILFRQKNRLMLSWGTIDPQMSNYNFTGDTSIFPDGTFSSTRDITAASDGNITSGCFYDSHDMNVQQVNASWATSEPQNDGIVATSNSSFASLLALSNNLTTCGVSPRINETLLGKSASTIPTSYYNVSQASVWSWAAGEPTNSSSSDDDTSSVYRCAFMDITEAYNGHWRVEHCNQRYRVACRVNNQPYMWHLSKDTTDFPSAVNLCPPNSSFAVPRTGLESTYLRQHMLSLPRSIINPASVKGDATSGVWINFNSLDMRGCWTADGANATCPYINDAQVHQRTVLVPVVAAIIVLVVTAVTLFVKCNANRRMSRRRKRGEGGWDYEGVPS